MKTYTITIDGKEVTTIANESGEWSDDRYLVEYKESKTIETENLTRKDIVKTLKEMLYLTSEYNEASLFDGNETYFIFEVIENGAGYEASEQEIKENKTLYGAQYFIDIEVVEKINAIDIN